MSVRNMSGRTPHGFREESAACPLYPTRPDPTRPFKSLWSPSITSTSYVTRTARVDVMPRDER